MTIRDNGLRRPACALHCNVPTRSYSPHPIARQTGLRHLALMDSALDSVISYLLLLSHDSWSLLHSSLPAYSELQTIARTLVSDTTLSDDTLIKRAREHLRVFKLPQCAKYNYPRWIATRLVPSLSSQPDRVRAVTAERTFDALIQTAKDLDLGIGLRYPPAEICACAQLLAPFGSDPLPERLAAELHALIFSVWWDALWAPGEYTIRYITIVSA